MSVASTLGRLRSPLLFAMVGACGLLGLVQAAVLLVRNQSFMSPGMALGLSRLALLVALVTMVLLLPVVLILRRRGEVLVQLVLLGRRLRERDGARGDDAGDCDQDDGAGHRVPRF